jgi:hypothetical protein
MTLERQLKGHQGKEVYSLLKMHGVKEHISENFSLIFAEA